MRIRLILLSVLLVLVVGAAGYYFGMNAWTGRKLQAANQALERHEYHEAAEHLEGYLAYHPSDVAARVQAAQTARRLGKFDDAVRQLELAEKHGAPADAIAIERRLLRVHAGDLQGVDDLKLFCFENPDGPESALILEVLIEGGLKSLHPALAKWSVDLWLKHHTSARDQAQGLMWRGRAHELVEDIPQAVADYQQAAEQAPDWRQPRLLLVEVHLRADPRQAVPHLDWLRQRFPDDPQVRFLTARWHRALGRPEEAGGILDAILATTPDKVPVLVERGRVALDLNRAEDAERWLQKAVALAPERREVHLALADCYRQAGRLDESKRHLDRAAEIEARIEKRFDSLTGPGKK